MNGLHTLFANCAFASTLEDLNLSYCQGVERKTIFAGLKPLQYLRRLSLDSSALDNFNRKGWSKFKSINFINFPNREEELDDILQDFSDIPSLRPVRLNGITKEVCEDEYYNV
ncbi:hypothetical protein C2G38_2188918 [Gigaspora rosea]|uniref:Uncharacterized protein n=1 Tax=Gigaspora rosea TaxID=44941 RepID=A0A397V302_9GLOM|nr:hypothetical protein C2G38_2188918 [Gigaspora rosea]